MSGPSRFHSVFLNEASCNGCTTCVTGCPVEAIRVRDGKAVILEQRCIDCGECIRCCPSHAKRALSAPLDSISRYKEAVLLVSPSFYAQFEAKFPVKAIQEALLSLGFSRLYDVSDFAYDVSYATAEFLRGKGHEKPIISSSCPAILKLIQIRFPSLIENILPILPPVEIAARVARKECARGDCIADASCGAQGIGGGADASNGVQNASCGAQGIGGGADASNGTHCFDRGTNASCGAQGLDGGADASNGTQNTSCCAQGIGGGADASNGTQNTSCCAQGIGGGADASNGAQCFDRGTNASCGAAGDDSAIGIFFVSPCPAKITVPRLPLGYEKSAITAVFSAADMYLPVLNALKTGARAKQGALLCTKGGAYRKAYNWGISDGEINSLNKVLKEGEKINWISCDGIKNTLQILEAIESGSLDTVDFAELSICTGGCIGGPLLMQPVPIAHSIMRSRLQTIHAAEKSSDIPPAPQKSNLHWTHDISPRPALLLSPNFKEARFMMEQIESIVKELPSLNCGACGSPNCRALAEDIVKKQAKKEDCIHILKQQYERLLFGSKK